MPDIKPFYGTPAAVTITTSGLATDANLLTGNQSVEIDNTVLRARDYLVSGSVTVTGTTGVVELWVAPAWDNTGTIYPDQITSAGAVAKTLTSATAKNNGLSRIGLVTVTAAGTFPIASADSLASLFDGFVCPPRFVFFITHSTGANLGANSIRVQPVYETVG